MVEFVIFLRDLEVMVEWILRVNFVKVCAGFE